MDSDLALVDAAPPTPYFLGPADLTDTVIFANPSKPLYRITTDPWHIHISATDGLSTPKRLVADLHRRDILSDILSFPDRRVPIGGRNLQTNVSAQRWLRRVKVLDGASTFIFDTAYGPYVWKVVSTSQTKVFADDNLDRPDATCFFPRSQPTSIPAFVVQFEGEPLRDDIVVAYCVQWHRLMMGSKALDLLVGLTQWR